MLQHVWAKMGMPSGKYLAATMGETLDSLDRFNELDGPRYTPDVRAQLLAISGATIDRRLAPTKAAMTLRGVSTTKPGSMLRSSIPIRRAGKAATDNPGFGETDLVSHCGFSSSGQFAHTLNLTDVCTSWTEPVAITSKAKRSVLAGLKVIRTRLPFELVGLDFDNGSEFVNHVVVGWARDEGLELTRSRPFKSNDNAHVEQKNADVVRRLVFHYRYDTAAEVELLNELYGHARLRFNLFTATRKAIGWVERPGGRRVRVYDKPRTPMQRVIDSGVLTQAKIDEWTALKRATNPAQLTRDITRIQDQLIKLSAAKTQAATRAAVTITPESAPQAS
jgi:hypothetical protein